MRGVELREFSMEEHIENWCANVDLALEYASDPGAYLCSYERLVTDPVAESRRIWDFLGLREGTPFAPRPTKDVGFDLNELDRITEATAGQVEALERWKTR